MNIFQKILSSVVHLGGIVDFAEQAIPAAKKGAQKLGLVLDIAGAAYRADPELVKQISSHDYLAAITGIVNAIVAAKNVVRDSQTPQPVK